MTPAGHDASKPNDEAELSRQQIQKRELLISLATKAIAGPVGISLVTVILFVLVASHFRIEVVGSAFALLVAGGLFSAPFLIFAGEIIGWFAWRFFGTNHRIAIQIAVGTALIVDLSVFAWVLFLMIELGIM